MPAVHATSWTGPRVRSSEHLSEVPFRHVHGPSWVGVLPEAEEASVGISIGRSSIGKLGEQDRGDTGSVTHQGHGPLQVAGSGASSELRTRRQSGPDPEQDEGGIGPIQGSSRPLGALGPPGTTRAGGGLEAGGRTPRGPLDSQQGTPATCRGFGGVGGWSGSGGLVCVGAESGHRLPAGCGPMDRCQLGSPGGPIQPFHPRGPRLLKSPVHHPSSFSCLSRMSP